MKKDKIYVKLDFDLFRFYLLLTDNPYCSNIEEDIEIFPHYNAIVEILKKRIDNSLVGFVPEDHELDEFYVVCEYSLLD